MKKEKQIVSLGALVIIGSLFLGGISANADLNNTFVCRIGQLDPTGTFCYTPADFSGGCGSDNGTIPANVGGNAVCQQFDPPVRASDLANFGQPSDSSNGSDTSAPVKPRRQPSQPQQSTFVITQPTQQQPQQQPQQQQQQQQQQSSNGSGSTGECDVSSLSTDYTQYIGKDVTAMLQTSPCGKASTLADKCCGNPASCLAGNPSSDPETQDSTMVGQLFQMVTNTAVSLPGAIGDVCGRMKDAAYATSTLNGVIVARCQANISSCKSSCQSLASKANADLNNFNALLTDDQKKNPNCKVLRVAIQNVATEYSSLNGICQSATNVNFQNAQQAVSSQMAGKMAAMCQQQAQQQQANPLAPDCSQIANQANPYCQYECGLPTAAANPQCAAILAQLRANQGTGPGFAANPNNLNQDPFAGMNPQPESAQSPVPVNVPAGSSGLAKTEGGGSGGSLGGGGSPGGGSGPAGKAAAGGYDTSILRGMNSGNGYSTGPHMASGSNSGFSGYGGNGAGKDDLLAKKFNLKDFLPGGKNADQKNTFRGLASTKADISPSQDDIFQKITNRFYQVCLRDGLYDCATLKKMKAGGN